MNQLQIFENRLSNKPYCSDDLEYGLIIRNKKTAIKKKYIQPNSPHKQNWLIFDCDYKGALESVYGNNLPEPNIIATNQINGHSHLFYSIEEGVYLTENARVKPLVLLAKIEHKMTEILKADRSYGGLTAKNPLSDFWKTSQIAGSSYDLNYLADCMELPKKLPKGKDLSGLGRNASLFEEARFIAYSMVEEFKNGGNYDVFFKSMVFVCKNINNTFLTPLMDNEIYSVAKSISAWTWKKYRGSNSMNETQWKEYVKDTHNSEIQRQRQQKQVKSRILKTFDKREQAKELSKKLSQREVAKILNVSQKTISDWLK
jgi:DNA-binding transcriptional regulator YiaG